ncbi:MAG: metal-sensitive transcriptional regulator [Chloroflexi bacterium]|nr:metal-sensitive transcriptional regulator [Chloroflexota bacterium]
MAKRKRSKSEVYLDPELEDALHDRLSRIEGHIRGINRMLDQHKDCEDILTQLAAVRAALNQVTIKLLEGHMTTCVTGEVEKGDAERALEVLREAVSTALKRA